MLQISIEEMQKELPFYLRRVEAGETVVIVREGKAIAEITPAQSTELKQERPYGLAAGLFTVPDDFDAPLPEDILQQFEGVNTE